MPYEEAITEAAKATNNAVNLIREGGRAVGPAVGEIYGLVFGDAIAETRKRRLDALARKTKKILHDRDVKERLQPPEHISIPLLEAAQGEPRDEMQELWARLLANAMDPARADDVRPEFIETLRRFHPIDAAILQRAGERRDSGSINDVETSHSMGLRMTAVRTSFDFLQKVNCGDKSSGGSQGVDMTFVLSDYGVELLIALAV